MSVLQPSEKKGMGDVKQFFKKSFSSLSWKSDHILQCQVQWCGYWGRGENCM